MSERNNNSGTSIPERIPRISSKDNPLIRRVRSLRHAKFRRTSGFYPVEGVRLVEDAVTAGVTIPVALVSPRLFRGPRGRDLAMALQSHAERMAAIPDYSEWNSIRNTAISPNGNWMTYAYTPNDGDATLHIRAIDADTLRTAINGKQVPVVIYSRNKFCPSHKHHAI